MEVERQYLLLVPGLSIIIYKNGDEKFVAAVDFDNRIIDGRGFPTIKQAWKWCDENATQLMAN